MTKYSGAPARRWRSTLWLAAALTITSTIGIAYAAPTILDRDEAAVAARGNLFREGVAARAQRHRTTTTGASSTSTTAANRRRFRVPPPTTTAAPPPSSTTTSRAPRVRPPRTTTTTAPPTTTTTVPPTTTTRPPATTTTTRPPRTTTTTVPPTTTTLPPTTTTLPPTTTTVPPTTTTTNPPPPPTTTVPPANQDAVTFFLDGINALRAEAGVPPLVLDAGLSNYAQEWSAYMADTGDFRHSDISQLLGPWRTVGENIAWGYSTQSMLSGLTGSPGHYRNMTNGGFTHVGIGVMVDASGRIWTTHVFGG